MGDSAVTVTLRTAEARSKTRSATFLGVQETFELDIKPLAKEGSPVDTGHNRRTIDTNTEETATGVKAELFTQSGYGGYLELGTRKMRARPYLFPAFQEGITRLRANIKRRMQSG